MHHRIFAVEIVVAILAVVVAIVVALVAIVHCGVIGVAIVEVVVAR